MASKYLESFLSAIPAGQRSAIKALLDDQKLAGEISSAEEYKSELERLLKLIAVGEDFVPGFIPVHVDENEPSTLSSAAFNNTFRDILTDLTGLYAQINASDRTLIAHDSLRKSDWVRVRDAINKLTEDLVRHRYLKLNDEWQDVKYFDFWTARSGESTVQAAMIDPETKVLTLNLKASRRIEQLRGPMSTQAAVHEITASGVQSSSSDFKPTNALDTNTKKFWAHLLLTDNPVTTSWKSVSYDGALVGLTITFSNAEFINNVAFLPFAHYPLQLIDLEYYDGSWATVPGFSAPAGTLDWSDIRFERIQASAVRLILFQPSYTRNVYLVPRSAFNLSRLWDQVIDKELLLGIDEEDLTGAQQGEIETNPRFRSYLSALKRVETRLGQTGIVKDVLTDHENTGRILEAVTQVITDTRADNSMILKNVVRRETDAEPQADEDLLEIDKIEYLFGVRSVQVRDNNYLPVGIHRSPQFVMRANPYEIALDVVESHVELTAPEGGTTYRNSSIEYELELSPDRKHNVLPEGVTQVSDELVACHPQTLQGTLRFAPSGVVLLRASGRLLTNLTDYSVSGRTVTVLRHFSPNYRYTATYTPVAAQDSLDVDSLYDSVPLTVPEMQDHTDAHGMIDLLYYPYVAYEIVNDDTDWTKDPIDAKWFYRGAGTTIDGIAYATSGTRLYEPLAVHVNGVRAINITNYRERIHPGFRNDPDQSPILQYIHAGKRLYFSRPLTDVTIEVLYRWMVQYIRLNATLRGHQAVVNSYTPVLSNYMVKIRTGF